MALVELALLLLATVAADHTFFDSVGDVARADSCACGWVNRERIVGGKKTGRNEYPLVVGLQKRNTGFQFCGGTILTEWHVITAAHCTRGKEAGEIQVSLGAHERYGADRTRIGVKQIVDHEGYTEKYDINDISLLLTARKIPFSKTIGPACLPNRRMRVVNEYVKILGWGRTSDNGTSSDVLRQVDLRVIPPYQCMEYWKNLSPNTTICTFKNGKDSCNGDSGGPVIWLDYRTQRYTIVGLVSYGGKCAGSKPGVNTDVTAYIDWIQEKIKVTKPGTQTCANI